MRLLSILLTAAALTAQDRNPQQEKSPQIDEKHTNENMYRQRGQSGPPDESPSWTRGRLGTQAPLPGKLITLNGILIDSSCKDRSAFNLGLPPEDNTADPAALANGGGAPPPRVEAQRTADAVARAQDPTCAITGGTRGFALLMTEGRLLNLDEGGNTMVSQALLFNPEGNEVLNGTRPGFKPRVTLQGRVHGDRFIVEKVVKL